jgi:tetratricopeptide (TPR) repeat protein
MAGNEVRLLAFPGLERFTRSGTKDLSRDHVRDYVAKTSFEQQSLISGIGDMNRLLADRSGSIRKDWRMTAHEDLDGSFFSEQILPVGAKACVIGRYSEKERGIVPEANVGGVRVIRGSREEALEFLRDKITGTWIAAVLLIAVPGPALWGILTYSEHYNIRNGKESVLTEMKTRADDYRNLKYFEQAETLYKRSLALKEKVLGPNHPEVAESLEDLARNYQESGQQAQADLLYKRAEAIRNSPKAPPVNH